MVFLIKFYGDLPAAHTGKGHAKDSAYHRGSCLVYNDPVSLGGVHFIAVDRFSANKQPLRCLSCLTLEIFLEISLAYMSFMMARKGVMSLAVESTPVSIPSNKEMYRTRCSEKYRSM